MGKRNVMMELRTRFSYIWPIFLHVPLNEACLLAARLNVWECCVCLLGLVGLRVSGGLTTHESRLGIMSNIIRYEQVTQLANTRRRDRDAATKRIEKEM